MTQMEVMRMEVEGGEAAESRGRGVADGFSCAGKRVGALRPLQAEGK